MSKHNALTEPVYYILLSLLTPMHGYGIMQNVKKLTNGRVNIGAGTLYGAINTLLSKGFIAEYKSDPSKKEYIITEVTVARYNQIGSEGTSSHTVAQESMSWADDLLAPYMDDLQDYLTRQETARRGRLRFL